MLVGSAGNGASEMPDSRDLEAEKVIKEQDMKINSLIKQLTNGETTLAEVVGPLVEKVTNLEMANESREKSAADSCSVVRIWLQKLTKCQSVSDVSLKTLTGSGLMWSRTSLLLETI